MGALGGRDLALVWRLGFHGEERGNFSGGYARWERKKRVTSSRVRGLGGIYSRRGGARVVRGTGGSVSLTNSASTRTR